MDPNNETQMRNFVQSQLNDAPDLRVLTLGVLKRQYMSHVGCGSLSPEAKTCIKRIVEEELLNMQTSDPDVSESETVSLGPSINKRKRGADDEDASGRSGDEDESSAKKMRRGFPSPGRAGKGSQVEANAISSETGCDGSEDQAQVDKPGDQVQESEEDLRINLSDRPQYLKGTSADAAERQQKRGKPGRKPSSRKQRTKASRLEVWESSSSEEEDQDRSNKGAPGSRLAAKRKVCKRGGKAGSGKQQAKESEEDDKDPLQKESPGNKVDGQQKAAKGGKKAGSGKQRAEAAAVQVNNRSSSDLESEEEDHLKKGRDSSQSDEEGEHLKKGKDSSQSDEEGERLKKGKDSSQSDEEGERLKKGKDSSQSDEEGERLKKGKDSSQSDEEGERLKKGKDSSQSDEEGERLKKGKDSSQSDEDGTKEKPTKMEITSKQDGGHAVAANEREVATTKTTESGQDSDCSSSSLTPLEEEEDGEGEGAPAKKLAQKKGDKSRRKDDDSKKEKLENKAVQRLKRYIFQCGVRRNYKKLLHDCRSVRSKVDLLKQELEGLGVHGTPSLEKCKTARLRREEAQELAGLDVSNIITTQGRPKRRAAWASSPAARYKRAVNSDSDEGPLAGTGCNAGRHWGNLQGIISDDGDSD